MVLRLGLSGAVAITILVALAPDCAPAQDRSVVVAPIVRWGSFDPYSAITTRVYAQASLIYSGDSRAVEVAAERMLQGRALDDELDVWAEHLGRYWERRVAAQNVKLEMNRIRQIQDKQYLNDRKARNALTWDRLENHPEMTAAGIAEGRALNFLLHRLANTALAYEFARRDDVSPDTFRNLMLPDATLHALKLRQRNRSGGATVFRADDSIGLDVEWWPYLLRRPEFDEHRKMFESVRDRLVGDADANTGNVGVENLERVKGALLSLTQEFYAKCRKYEWARRGFEDFGQFRSAELFLQSLDNEIKSVENSGSVRAFRGRGGYDPERDGDHLIGLLTFMTRSGLEFAPAASGEEYAYHQVFAMMRDIYVNSASHDEGIQAKDLTRELNRVDGRDQ